MDIKNICPILAIILALLTQANATKQNFNAIANTVNKAMKGIVDSFPGVPEEVKTALVNITDTIIPVDENGENNTTAAGPFQSLIEGVFGGTTDNTTESCKSNQSSIQPSSVSAILHIDHDSSGQNTPDRRMLDVVGGLASAVLPLDLNQSLSSLENVTANVTDAVPYSDSDQITSSNISLLNVAGKVLYEIAISENTGSTPDNPQDAAVGDTISVLPLSLNKSPLSGVENIVPDVVDTDPSSNNNNNISTVFQRVGEEILAFNSEEKPPDEQSTLICVVNAVQPVENAVASVGDAVILVNNDSNMAVNLQRVDSVIRKVFPLENGQLTLDSSQKLIQGTASAVVPVKSVVTDHVDPIINTNHDLKNSELLQVVDIEKTVPVDNSSNETILSGLPNVVSVLVPDGIQDVLSSVIDAVVLTSDNLDKQTSTEVVQNMVTCIDDITVPPDSSTAIEISTESLQDVVSAATETVTPPSKKITKNNHLTRIASIVSKLFAPFAGSFNEEQPIPSGSQTMVNGSSAASSNPCNDIVNNIAQFLISTIDQFGNNAKSSVSDMATEATKAIDTMDDMVKAATKQDKKD